MRANAPGGETIGQVGKAFKCTLPCVGNSLVTSPKLKESSAHRKQVAKQGNDGLSSLWDPICQERTEVPNFPYWQTASHQKKNEFTLQSGGLIIDRVGDSHTANQCFRIPRPNVPRGPGLVDLA